MFRGRYDAVIDDKGRVSVPSRFRDALATSVDEKLILTTFDGCLWGYPTQEWIKIEERVAALPQFKSSVKALQRVFVSGAMECPIDKQGRIIIPPNLRDYAGLKKEIIFVGMTKKIEIWAKEQWVKTFNDALKEVDGSEELADLGI